MQPPHWNHNIHYHPLLLAAAPDGCKRALDVGCGSGLLVRQLRAVSERVVGIDLDEPSVEQARAIGGDGVEYLLGDFLRHPFEPSSFDMVASVATLHHMDAETALARMASLVRPGGVLALVGLARSRGLMDLALDVAGAVASRVHRHLLRKHHWQHSAPVVWPPALAYTDLHAIAERRLPGVAYRRHVLFRYSLLWTRPLGRLPHPGK